LFDFLIQPHVRLPPNNFCFFSWCCDVIKKIVFVRSVDCKSVISGNTPEMTTPTPGAGANVGANIRVRCLFDYAAQNAKELSFKKDDTLRVLHQHPSGWWRGANIAGDEGLFPSNFVRVLEFVGIVRALYDYEGNTAPNLLSFKKGTKIDVISKDKSGWWKGDLNGRVGLFPMNFVEELPPEPVEKPTTTTPAPVVATATVAALVTPGGPTPGGPAPQQQQQVVKPSGPAPMANGAPQTNNTTPTPAASAPTNILSLQRAPSSVGGASTANQQQQQQPTIGLTRSPASVGSQPQQQQQQQQPASATPTNTTTAAAAAATTTTGIVTTAAASPVVANVPNSPTPDGPELQPDRAIALFDYTATKPSQVERDLSVIFFFFGPLKK
jgi:hypothetical protein